MPAAPAPITTTSKCAEPVRISATGSVAEELLDAIEPALGTRIVLAWIFLVDLFELAQKLLLPRRQLDRRFDRHVTVQVAGGRCAHRTDTFVAQAERLAALRLGRDVDRGVAFERRDLELATECCGGEADRHLA